MQSLDKIERYSRQLPIIGEKGQKKLKDAKVLIAGVGGLGSVVSIYLTAAGVGRLVLVDNDIVKLPDLNRQILYTQKDIGRKKVLVAKERLQMLNSDVEIVAVDARITTENINSLVENVDIVVDCLDNWHTRMTLDKAIRDEKKILVHGGIEGLYGQVTVIVPYKTICLRCLVSEPKDKEFIPVLGTTAGIIGLVEATEVIKLITGIGKPLINRMLIYDGHTMEFSIIELKPTDKCLNICWG